MTSQLVPLIPAEAAYNFDCVLDGNLYGFQLTWSVRQQAWTLILSRDGTSQISVKLASQVPLLATFKGLTNIPPGELVVFSADNSEPTFETLGTKHLLYYVPEADVAAFLALPVEQEL